MRYVGSSRLLVTLLPALALVASAHAEPEGFSAADVPPYRGSHDAVYAHIDANVDSHVAELQRWVRQPSISAVRRLWRASDDARGVSASRAAIGA